MTDIIGGGSGSFGGSGGVNNPTGTGGAGSVGDGGGGGGAGYLVGGAGGAGSYPGSGTGGTGGIHGYFGVPLPLTAATGTNGSAGGQGASSSAGGGGGGGYGAVVTGSGNLGTQFSNVVGGDGGDGGDASTYISGDGGRGGIGLYFDSDAGASLTISASIAGGDGGAAGDGRWNGNAGSGGEGIYGQNLSITLTSGGSISGGLSGDGVTRADAIYFEAGTNLLDIQGGTITGNVVANGSNDTFRLSGSTGGTFDVSQLGTKFQGFEHLGSAGTATWILTGNNATSQSWSASSGMIVVNGAMANTDFNIGIGATLGGSGTVGDVLAFGTVGLGDGVGILHTGDFQLYGRLIIEVGGAMAGSGYDQISVTGTVTLSAVLELSFLNNHAPAIGDSITIIDNDGTDAVSGDFAGLAEGRTYFSGGTAYQITYHGGDGNDVVLTRVNAIRGGGAGSVSTSDNGDGGMNNPTGAGGDGLDGYYTGGGGGGGAGADVGGEGGWASNGNGSGGAGGVHGYVGATLVIGPGTIAGTNGVDGESATYGGGGGGAGGYGAVVTGTGNLGSLTSAVTGGDGGDGGAAIVLSGGNGGRGGIGLYLDNTTGATMTVAAAITGGDGGAAGVRSAASTSASAGDGGEGIYGQNLSITLASGGSIVGGLGGDGVTRANAILFTGGTNLLDMQGGTITGNVVANGSDDTFRLGGSTGGTLDISQIQGFEHVGSTGSATWTLTGTNSTSQSWSATAGTLVVNGTMANTDFTIGSGATLGGSGTLGDVTVQSGGSIGPGNSPGILSVGDFSLSGTLEIEISGTTVGAEYDQVSVTGTVTLGGALDVSFLNSFLASAGDSFTIIDNDNADAVSGTFNGLVEGAFFTLGSNDFQISYHGGDGNDVVLTSVTLTPTEAVNTQATVAEGGAVIISAAELAFSDLDQTAANLVYTVTSAVTHGTLYRNGVTLGLNDTFTQADIDNNRITYQHDGDETTSASFGFSISDGQGRTVSGQTFSFTVTPVNDAPTVANAIGDQAATEDSAFSFQFASNIFADVDVGDTLTYTATLVDGSALPSWLTFNAATCTFSGTPANGDVGTIAIKVTASDGSASVFDTFDLAIGNTNDGPTVANGIAEQTATEDSAYSFQFASNVFADVDMGDTLTYTASLSNGSALPSWLTFDPANRTFSGVPTNGDVGMVSIKVTASDGTASVSDTFDIVIGNTNDAPTDISVDPVVVIDGSRLFVAENTSGVNIGDVYAIDPDLGDTATFAVDDSRFEIINGVLKLKDDVLLDFETESTVAVTITVEDAEGLAYDEVFTINVVDGMDRKSGGNGNDRLLGTSGSDYLYGRQGDDVLKGFDGDDRLRSTRGDDRFWGGNGADTFVFSTRSGHDQIMDFETGIDTIDVSRWKAIDDFSDIKSHAQNRNGDLWIVAGDDALIIKDFSKREPDAGDFVFSL